MADTELYVYKNTGKVALTVANAGVVEPGETIKTVFEVSHHDLKKVTTVKSDENHEDNKAESKK